MKRACEYCEVYPADYSMPKYYCHDCFIRFMTSCVCLCANRNQRIIIIDGPDQCGKSQIANAVSQKLGIPVFKNKGEWKNFGKNKKYFRRTVKYGDLGMLAPFLEQTKASVIFDRGYPSERVYSTVFARTTCQDILKQVDELYASLDTRIIITLRKDYSKQYDKHNPSVNEKLLLLHDEYLSFSKWTKCKVQTLCVDDEDLTREMNEILPFIARI